MQRQFEQSNRDLPDDSTLRDDEAEGGAAATRLPPGPRRWIVQRLERQRLFLLQRVVERPAKQRESTCSTRFEPPPEVIVTRICRPAEPAADHIPRREYGRG